MPTAPIRRRSSRRNEPHPLAALVARRHAHRLRLVRGEEAGRLRAEPGDGRAPGGGQLPRQQQLAGLVARRPPARGHAHQGRRLAALPHERRRQQRAARDDVAAPSTPRRTSRPTASRSCSRPTAAAARRSIASTSAAAPSSASRSTARTTSRRVRIPDGKGFVFVRRDGGRFQIATQDFATRQMQVLTGGPGDESPEHRAQRQADPLRERVRGAWYIGRRLERRPRQAAPRRGGRRCPRTGVGTVCAIAAHRSGRRSTRCASLRARAAAAVPRPFQQEAP